MKTRKYHIISSWILLICFIAGQYMIYTHQHNMARSTTVSYRIARNMPLQTVSEKCAFCDVMHHNTMIAVSKAYTLPVTATGHVFKKFHYNFTSIQLILSGGRAPPALIAA